MATTTVEVVKRKDELKYKARIRKYLFGKKLIEVCRTFDSRQGATRWLEEAKQIEKKEGYKGLVYLKLNQKVTVGGALDKLMSNKNFLDTTSKQVISNLKMLKGFSITKIELAYLMPCHLIEHVNERKTKNPAISPATISVDLSNLKSALKQAKTIFTLRFEVEVFEEACFVLRKQKAIAQSTPRERLLSDVEMERLTEYVQAENTTLPLADIVGLANEIGPRLGEITKVPWDDYNRKEGTLTIRNRKSPNCRKPTSVIQLTESQVHLIERQMPKKVSGDQPIFPYLGGSITAAFRKAVQKAGIEDYQFRDLKAHAVTTMFKAGKTLEEIGKITGNRSTKILYGHYLRLIELSTK
ncbi:MULTISPECIES: tyrosine-type recombinase/integrase [unclassified Vibrio]|uniref:tyrosine-type recombinase/integrase n=1 Tax=unclassified Vibrio TaxID=2614977 RepID=UPI00355100E6